MIVCPNCNHQNPDAATQCEACYTPLPAMTTCPSCGSAVQTDASFCGQCGFNLQGGAAQGEGQAVSPLPATVSPDFGEFEIPDLPLPDPLVELEPLVAGVPSSSHAEGQSMGSAQAPQPSTQQPTQPAQQVMPSVPVAAAAVPPAQASSPMAASSKTQLQTQVARLLHVQTNTIIELPATLAVIHVGKPNDRVPPDVDVSGFPNSEIVSRIHADIRVEGDTYYIEDVGSSNGTYINNAPLPTGNRHRLRPGDRIALGKGDKVTFLFQIV